MHLDSQSSLVVTVASNPVSLAGLTTQCGTGLKLGSSRGVGTLVLDLACGGWFRWKTGPVCQHTVDTSQGWRWSPIDRTA